MEALSNFEVSFNLEVWLNLDGFASTEIFLVDVGGLSGFIDEGRSSDKVTFFVTGFLGAGAGDCEEDCLLSSGFFSVVAILGGEAGLFVVIGVVSPADRNDCSDRDDSELSLDGRVG